MSEIAISKTCDWPADRRLIVGRRGDHGTWIVKSNERGTGLPEIRHSPVVTRRHSAISSLRAVPRSSSSCARSRSGPLAGHEYQRASALRCWNIRTRAATGSRRTYSAQSRYRPALPRYNLSVAENCLAYCAALGVSLSLRREPSHARCSGTLSPLAFTSARGPRTRRVGVPGHPATWLLPASPLSYRPGSGVHAQGPLAVPRVPRPAADRRLLPVRAGRLRAHVLLPEDNTEDTVALAWIQGAQVCFNEDGTFHSINDAASIQYLTETLSAAQGTGPVGYIHGGGAGVINS